jgi:hypothetical protein
VFYLRYIILIYKGVNIALSKGEIIIRNVFILYIVVIIDFRLRFYIFNIALIILILIK